MMLLATASEPVVVTITPATSSPSGGTNFNNFSPSATVNKGSPSAYSWGIQSGTGGSVVSGGTTATPTLRITDPVQGDGPQPVTFYCDVTVDGVVYRGTCNYSWNWV